MLQEPEQIKFVGDALSVSTVVATIAGWLPALAALISFIWGCIRIYETKAVQRLLHRGRHDRRATDRHPERKDEDE